MIIGMAMPMPRLRGSRKIWMNSLRAMAQTRINFMSAPLLGLLRRSRASIKETKTSSREGMIFSI